MKKFLIALALASSVALGGCAVTNGVLTIFGTPVTVANVIAAVQNACALTPTADSITNLLTSNPSFQTAEAVAAIICEAAGTPTASAHAPVTVNGKVVTFSSHAPVSVNGVTVKFQ